MSFTVVVHCLNMLSCCMVCVHFLYCYSWNHNHMHYLKGVIYLLLHYVLQLIVLLHGSCARLREFNLKVSCGVFFSHPSVKQPIEQINKKQIVHLILCEATRYFTASWNSSRCLWIQGVTWDVCHHPVVSCSALQCSTRMTKENRT